jgi:ubiquinone/menaquinone biosynthesis C-methylase UbiE
VSGSVSFDSAAEQYDRTRALPPEAQAQVTSLLAQELKGRGPCLEVGVGTGRIAVPLRDGGVEVIGIDLSLAMLRRLQEKGGPKALPAVRADATRLPFRDHGFGGSLACHVLHLIPDWRLAATEMVRVTQPGGVVLIDHGSALDAWQELTDQFFHHAPNRRGPIGLSAVEDLDVQMSALGASVRQLDPIEAVHRGAVGAQIDSLEQGVFAGCWDMTPVELRRAAAATRRWAVAHYGSLDSEVEARQAIVWRAYDLAK